MGLKTKNYVSKSTGLPSPTAYAVMTNLIIEKNNSARAIFAIQSTREALDSYDAIDKVEVRFTWDRKRNPAEQAYEEAKAQKLKKHNYETDETVTENGVLFGWQDDIL